MSPTTVLHVLKKTKKKQCPSLVHNHMSEVQQLFTMKYNHTY